MGRRVAWYSLIHQILKAKHDMFLDGKPPSKTLWKKAMADYLCFSLALKSPYCGRNKSVDLTTLAYVVYLTGCCGDKIVCGGVLWRKWRIKCDNFITKRQYLSTSKVFFFCLTDLCLLVLPPPQHHSLLRRDFRLEELTLKQVLNPVPAILPINLYRLAKHLSQLIKGIP